MSITYYDDKKGKWQSFEMYLNIELESNSSGFGNIDITAYGEDKQEAFEYMQNAIDKSIEKLKDYKKIKIEDIKEN